MKSTFNRKLTRCRLFPDDVDGVLTAVFVWFVIELIVSFTVDPSYRLSLRFFTDLVGTISVAFDIHFMFGQYTVRSLSPLAMP